MSEAFGIVGLRQMIKVFLSSIEQKPRPLRLADVPSKGGRHRKPGLDRAVRSRPEENIVSRSRGLDADFILLIHFPRSVDSSWVKEEWTDAFWEQTNDRKTESCLACCTRLQIPRAAAQQEYFDLRKNQPRAFAKSQLSLLTSGPAPARVTTCRSAPPLFIGAKRSSYLRSDAATRVRAPRISDSAG